MVIVSVTSSSFIFAFCVVPVDVTLFGVFSGLGPVLGLGLGFYPLGLLGLFWLLPVLFIKIDLVMSSLISFISLVVKLGFY